jgi:hypothetical protein
LSITLTAQHLVQERVHCLLLELVFYVRWDAFYGRDVANAEPSDRLQAALCNELRLGEVVN